MSMFEEIEESTAKLLDFGVQRIHEAVQMDMKAHPEGLEGFCRDVGIDPKTARCWWNPNHGRSMNLSNLVTLLLVIPGTHTKAAMLEVADVFAQHRKGVVERKLRKIRGQMAKVVQE